MRAKKKATHIDYTTYGIAGLYWLVAIALFLALYSYSATDPSFNVISLEPTIHNYMGLIGSYTADLLGQLFGSAAYILPFTLLTVGIKLYAGKLKRSPFSPWLLIWTLLLLVVFAIFLSQFNANKLTAQFRYPGGVIGVYLFNSLRIGSHDAITAVISGIISIVLYSWITNNSLATWNRYIKWCLVNLGRLLGWIINKILQVLTPVELYCRITHALQRIANSKIFLLLTAPTHLEQPTTSSKKTSFLTRWKTWKQQRAFQKQQRLELQQAQQISEKLKQWQTQEENSSPAETETVVATEPVATLLPTEPVADNNPTSQNNTIFANYLLPPLDLLKKPNGTKQQIDMQAAYKQNDELKRVLDDYGVRGKMLDSKVGPVITLHEFEPAAGTKAARIIGLADDIARSMRATSARIAIIHGKNALGIELPNPHREMIYLRELLASKEFTNFQEGLPIVLGKNIAGEAIIANLAKMPHLLVAGTTGSGKSVSINTMILSLLYRFTPDECKFIMVDPKMLELSIYDNIPHLLCPVVTEPKKAVVALKWVTKEMEDRYRAMAALGVRNINGYNDKIKTALQRNQAYRRKIQTGYNMETGEPVYEEQTIDNKPLPYIVVIVDEMADLMLVAGKEIENSIQRLAQMARAAGIHLIMATQRPSVDVITGVIKANFPTRISFQVTSRIDSRTIIGEQGAEQLLGQGDMLYMMGGGKILRAHGPFVSDEEIEQIVAFIKKQGEPQYISAVTDAENEEDFSGTVKSSGDKDEDLYRRAISVVKADGRTSISYVQRKLKIGYNKAASIIERMQDDGILSAPDSTGKREIIG